MKYRNEHSVWKNEFWGVVSPESDGGRNRHLSCQFPNKQLVFKFVSTDGIWHRGYKCPTVCHKELCADGLLWLLHLEACGLDGSRLGKKWELGNPHSHLLSSPLP